MRIVVALLLVAILGGMSGRCAPEGGGLTVVAAGDICPNVANLNRCDDTATLAASLDPGLVLPLGDAQYPAGSLSHFNEYYDRAWGQFNTKARPALGNHEVSSDSQANGFFDYFGDRAPPRDKGYAYWDLSPGWRLVVANSNCSFGSPDVGCTSSTPQGQWLAQTLDAAPGCALVAWHHTPASDGPHYTGGTSGGKQLWKIAVDHGADVGLVGHEHNYQRFRLDRNANPSGSGIPLFVVGTGGKGKGQLPSGGGRLAGQSSVHGVLHVTLTSTTLNYQFRPISGSYSDSGTYSCD